MDSPKRSLKGIQAGALSHDLSPENCVQLCLFLFSRNWSGTESPWETAHKGRKQPIGSLKVEHPLTLRDSMDCLVHETLQARILECVAFPFSRGSSQPRDRIEVSGLWEDYLPAEPQGKPKNTGVGSLSLLQQIFLTQESNRGLLHCRWICTSWATREAQYVNSGVLSIPMIITTITHHHHRLKCPSGNNVGTISCRVTQSAFIS